MYLLTGMREVASHPGGVFVISASGAHLQAGWTNGDQAARLISRLDSGQGLVQWTTRTGDPPSRPDRSRTPPIRYHLTAPCTCRLPVRPRHPDAVTLRSDARPGAESRRRLLARSPYWLAGMRICLPASPLMAGGGNAGSRPLRHAAREGAEAVALRSARCHGAPPPFVIENDSVRMNQRKGRPCDKSESGSNLGCARPRWPTRRPSAGR